jgi:hypothetical protein
MFQLVSAVFRRKQNPAATTTEALSAAQHLDLLAALGLQAGYAIHPLERCCGAHVVEAANFEEAFAKFASFVSAELTRQQPATQKRIVLRRIPIGLCSITPKGHVGHGCMARIDAQGNVTPLIQMPGTECAGVELTISDLKVPNVLLPSPNSDWL